ncbi:mediator-associated protein 1-like [Tripterygium wilfordii]|uniref:Mediator-associated protein 1-like n=1 Tax=Tripterygium wilfordii TaxID=458696 RepID=A0A7J7C386_TRIWF|nr:probable transcription factor At1g11510 [Tripterygium wilfordii]KAF5728619.1 mediator-associated protein 1-like [Tripterygium wilfordii]
MAKKRLTAMEEPPAASSSDEEVASSEEEAEEAESSSGEEEETEPKQPSPTPPQLKTTASTHTDASDSETESESDSGSDSEPIHSNVKPIASIHMEDNTTATKKPQSKPSVASKSATASKRINETDQEPKDSKRAKKKEKDVPNDASTEKSGDDTKKPLFQRLWSEDDEIVLLEGMIDFTEKNGKSPNADVDGFLEFIKKSLGFDATRSKLMEKMRRLKKKYENNAGKGKKKGEEMTFSKPHEQRAYELSKKIWGGEGTNGAGVESTVKPNGKAPKKGQTGSKSSAGVSSEFISTPRVKEEMKVVESAKERNGPLLLRGNESVKIDNSIGLAGMEGFLLNNGLGLVEESKRVEFEEKWKSIQLAEMELFVRRAEVIAEQAKLVLEAYKSAEN